MHTKHERISKTSHQVKVAKYKRVCRSSEVQVQTSYVDRAEQYL
jgi:hypothetical protein